MPSIAEDPLLPPEPENVEVNITQTSVQIYWDSPAEGDDGDDGDAPNADVPIDEEIEFFQVHLAEDIDFDNIIRKDRTVRGHSKTFRVHKPKGKTYYARVRSVNGLGNKSVWVSSAEEGATVPVPDPPTLEFKRQMGGDKLKAIATVQNVTFTDEDISRYTFALRETDFVKLTDDTPAGGDVINVDEYPDYVPNVPFDVSVQDEDMTVTSITGAQNLNWHVDRGVNGTTAAAHVAGKKVFYFSKDDKATHQTVSEEDGTTETSCVFRGCEEGARYRAKVRAIDAENRKSDWSDWCDPVKAKAGANSGGDPGDDSVTPTDWPYERALRIVATVSTGTESLPFDGIDGTITASRAEVESGPTSGDATVDVNVNGASILTCTIPSGTRMSELTWADPPGYIGKHTGYIIVPSDEITVTQTSMADCSGEFVSVVLIYLNDGTE
jgi:hypothetical protein